MKTSQFYIRVFWIIILYVLTLFSVIAQVEICDNGLDDDGDGLIDLNDEECACEIVELISFIDNPSFEEMDCCPDNRSQLDCATSWIQASEPTTDFIHTCDWMGWDNFPPPQPFPDGEGIMGFRDGRVRSSAVDPEPFWKEYAGACLLNPLLADSSYRFQFDVGFIDPEKSPPIFISFFGTTNCDNLPFGIGDEDFGCPSNDPNWQKLAEVFVSGGPGNTWINTYLDIVPEEDIYAIAIGPDCPPESNPISIYYFFDNLLLSDFESFDLQISETTHPCDQSFALSVPFNSDFEYQWYLNGIALQGEVFAELMQNYGEGSYQVGIIEESTCRASAIFEYSIPVFNETEDVIICEGEAYQFGQNSLFEPGFYLDTFITENGCDSIVAIDLQVNGVAYDTISVSIFSGDSYEVESFSFSEEGDYPLTLNSSLGCDSLVLLKLSTFDIYIPNAFTPNNDGINDVFTPFIGDEDITDVTMMVYDRWGNQLYEGAAWDGAEVQPGLYAYIILFEFTYGGTKMFSGDVTLIK